MEGFQSNRRAQIMADATLRKILTSGRGFTLLEVLAVLVILGILSAIAVSRSVNYNTEVYTGADALKAHLRYAQTMAMNSSPTTAGAPVVWGMSGTANSYWLFEGNDPSNAVTYIRLPEEEDFIHPDRTIDLTRKKIKLASGFTIFFDQRGIPYSAYTSATANTPLAAVLTINVQPLNAAAPSVAITLTPLTGYVP